MSLFDHGTPGGAWRGDDVVNILDARHALNLSGESSLERSFAEALVYEACDRSTAPVFVGPREPMPVDRDGLFISPQRRVLRFRPDFTLQLTEGGLTASLIAEVDGWAFHARKPEQIERDRARDAVLSAMGWAVMRFPESEIRADVRECARRAYAFLDDALFEAFYGERRARRT